MNYGKIDKDKLILSKNTDIYNSDIQAKVKPVGYKEMKFAKIPDFDQLTHAVYQAAPVDKGDYIEAGVVVVKMQEQVESLDIMI